MYFPPHSPRLAAAALSVVTINGTVIKWVHIGALACVTTTAHSAIDPVMPG